MGDEAYEIFKLGDWELQCGDTLPDAFIAYRTIGDPSSPAIIYPTWFSGLISENIWLIGEDKTLSPKKYFIIIPALFGNGQSASPSNHQTIKPFPEVSFYDNVRAQHKLVTEHLGIMHARAVLGWSMGAAQTFQWITEYPEFADKAIPFCGSAKTSIHNQVFLEGVKSALLAAKGQCSAGSTKVAAVPREEQVRTWSEEERTVGLKAFGRGYAGWEKLHEKHFGFKDLESFMQGFWETWACSKDPENLLSMLQTWQSGDVSKQVPFNGNFEQAMESIKTKTLVLPSKTDLYFPPKDSEYEVANMRLGIGKLDVYPSIMGHWAGGPGTTEEDVKWLDDHLRDFLT